MRSIILFLVLCSTAVYCYEINKVEGIEAGVWEFKFDQFSNTYLTTNNNGNYTFYKLDSSNKIVLMKPIRGIPYYLLNKQGDVYLFDVADPGASTTMVYLYYLNPNSNTPELIYNYLYQTLESCYTYNIISFIDDDDIVYVNQVYGVSFFRSREDTFLAVDDLQGVNFCDYEVDGDGNVYLALSDNKRIVVVSKESKKLPILHAETLIETDDRIIKFLMPGYQNRAIAAWYNDRNDMTVKLLSKNSTELLLSKYYTIIGSQLVTKDVFIYTAYDILENQHYGFILTPDKKIKKIKDQLFNALIGGYAYPSVTNSDGVVLFDKVFSSAEGVQKYGIVMLNPGKLEVETVVVPSQAQIDALFLDTDENLWILSNGLYLMEKGSKEVTQVSDVPMTAFNVKYDENYDHLLQKPVTKEIFIGAAEGLYILTE